MAKNPNLKVALDLTEEWDKLQGEEEEQSALLTGVVVVRSEFARSIRKLLLIYGAL